MNDKGPRQWRSPLRKSRGSSDRPAATDKVHDDGNDSEDQHDVNEEARDVEDKKSAEPQKDENDSENKKH